MAIAVLIVVLLALLTLNAIATFISMRSAVVTRRQKALQLAFIWLIPLAGAIVVLLVLGPSRPSRSSRSDGGESEEMLTAFSSTGGRSHPGHEALDAHHAGGDGQ